MLLPRFHLLHELLQRYRHPHRRCRTPLRRAASKLIARMEVFFLMPLIFER